MSTPAGGLPRRPRHVVTVRAARQQLDQWAPVTLVVAIQGYGKTTAVAEWLREQPHAVRSLWLNPRSSEAANLDRELLTQLEVEPKTGDLATRSEAPAHDSFPGVRRLDAIAGSMAAGERLVLVIDDPPAPVEATFLLALADVVRRRDGVHVVLCGRTRHLFASIREARLDTVGVLGSQLLMTVDEIEELASALDADLQPGQANELHECLGGWPAAVRQVLDQVAATGGSMSELPLSRAEHYLREEVLPHLRDQDRLAHILRLSLAERLTDELVQDLYDGDDAECTVGVLVDLGLAERRYHRDGVELVVPSFVRSALRRRYAQSEPDEARHMHARLAHWFATHPGPGHAMHGLRHAVAGGDSAMVERIWTRSSAELLFEHTRDLVDLLTTIAPEIVAAHPSMGAALQTGRAVFGIHPDGSTRSRTPSSGERKVAALRAYAAAGRRAAAKGLHDARLHDVLYVGTGAMMALRLEGRLADATAYGKLVERRATSLLAAGEDPGDRLPWFHLQRGITRTLQGHHAAAMHEYRLAWQLRQHSSFHVAGQASAYLALSHAVQGETKLALFWANRAPAAPGGLFPEQPATFEDDEDIGRGLIALDRLDRLRCEPWLEGLPSDSPAELWAYAACLRAQIGLHYREATTALADLDSAQRGPSWLPVSEEPATALLLARARADLLMAAGQGQRAQAVLLSHPDAERTPMLAVPLARLSLLAGDPTEARRIAAELVWSDTIDYRSRQELLLLKALAAHRIGDLAGSGGLMRQAIALYGRTGLLRPFATIDRDDLDVLFGQAGISLDAVDLAVLDAHSSPFPRTVTLVRLTPREREIAAALTTTASRQQIADQLYVSLNTVRTQLATLYRKLGVRTREDALTELARMGLLPRPDHVHGSGPRAAS